jgi:RecA-family ATPase
MPADNKHITPLDQRRICPSDNIERAQGLFYMRSEYEMAEVMTKGNISALVGRAKGRKSYFVKLLIASMKGYRDDQFMSAVSGKVALFDTEQAKYHIWKSTKQIEQMIGMWPVDIEVFGLRPDSTADRMNLIESYIYQQEPEMIFIDGIRDLVTDINDATQATEIVGKLMKWSYEKNCHICCVLHQNKADENARGHIGTELVNKSETVLSINKILGNTLCSEVKSLYTRGYEIKEFSFSIEGSIPMVKHEEVKSLQRQYETEKEECPFE